MNRFAGVLVAGLVLSASIAMSSGASAAPANLILAKDKGITDQYIVVLKDGPRINADSVAESVAASPLFVYDAVLNGFAAKLNPMQLRQLQKHPEVAYIEQDSEVSLQTMQLNAPWNLDRIDQLNLPLSNTYSYNTTASNVTAYVIDSGIYTAHPDFNGQALNVFDASGGNGQDCSGHGTHVAGIIGGQTWGVAKDVMLRGVKVTDCVNPTTTAMLITGINWVGNNAVKPAVANISAGGGQSVSVNNAVTNLVNRGITVTVAAGNSNANACNYSPASALGVLTVASSTITDAKASFSNYGSCVELYAPGASITSTWLNNGTMTLSGTSQASPHVAGVAALVLAYNPTYTPAQVSSWITTNATPNVISGNPAGTPNRLLYKSSL